MRLWKTILAATVLALATGTSAFAARTDLVIGIPLEPPHLDPTAGAAAAIDEVLYANVFEGLTRIGPKGEVLPDLAESWTISDDGKTYTFKLHTGVKFHDGTDFDANDVKFSLGRARADNSVNAQKGLFAAIDKVDVIDPATIKVTLKNPQGSFLYNMGWGDAVIVAPETADTNKEKPIGTGPFKFQSWAKGSSITLVKSDNYWGTPASLDKAEFRIVPDAAAYVPALLSGDIQAFPFFDADSVAQVKDDPRFKVVIGSTEGETILSINNKKPPFDKLAVRQALASAIDRKAVIDAGSSGLGTPIGSHFSPADPGYIDLTGVYPYDVAKAKEYLKEAGLPNGFKATLKLPPTPYARDGGQVIQSELKEIGVDVLIPSTYDKQAEASPEQLLSLIPQEHRDFLDDILAEHGVPPLPPAEQERLRRELAQGRGGMTPDGARRLIELSLRHPRVRMVVSALGTPPPDVVARLEASGARIYRTDRDGEITLVTDGHGVQVTTFVP